MSITETLLGTYLYTYSPSVEFEDLLITITVKDPKTDHRILSTEGRAFAEIKNNTATIMHSSLLTYENQTIVVPMKGDVELSGQIIAKILTYGIE